MDSNHQLILIGLDLGSIFFETVESITDGPYEAKSWAIHVKKKTKWAIIRAILEPNNVFDPPSNITQRKNLRKFTEIAKKKYLEEKETLDDFEEWRIYYILDRETDYDLIRALVDAQKDMSYSSHNVNRPQIQLCVKDITKITSVDIHEQSR
jgi:hypothetical protein